MRNLTFILFSGLLLFSTALRSQELHQLKLKVVDKKTDEPLIAANIFMLDTNEGVISDDKGFFNVAFAKWNDSLRISYIGYETKVLSFRQAQNLRVISLKRTEEFIDLVTIHAQPIIEPLTTKFESVVDFVIEDNRILLLTRERGKSRMLKLTDFEGKVLDRKKLKDIKNIEALSTSCLNTHFLIAEYRVFQIDLQDDQINLIYEDSRDDYDRFLGLCLDSNLEYIYFNNLLQYQQIAQIKAFHKYRDAQVNFGIVMDTLNALNYEEEKKYLDFMDNKGEDEWINLTDSESLEAFYDFWEKAALLKYNFYNPVNFHVHVDDESVFILDHENHRLNKFALNGKNIFQRPIQYSKERKWSKRILEDRKTEKVYTFLEYSSGSILSQILLSNGQLKPITQIEMRFVDDMQIYDDVLYYTDSGITAGEEARILKKVKL